MQQLTYKRVGLLFLFVAVTIGLGYALWYFFFRSPTTEIAAPSSTLPINGLPRAGGATTTGFAPVPPGALPLAGGVGVGTVPVGETGLGVAQPVTTFQSTLVATNITQPVSFAPGNPGVGRYYNPLDGKFYYALPDGGKAPLSSKAFFGVSDITWGKKTDKAIMMFPDGSKVFYDFNTDTQAILPSYWENIDFSPQDDQIIAKSLGKSRSNRFLVVASPDGTNAKAIEDLGDNQSKVQISWSPNNQVVAFSHTGAPLGQDREAVLLIGKEHENFPSLITDGRGFIPSWSPSGNIVAYSVYKSTTGYRPTLWVSGASGANVNAGRRNFEIATWADKCAWQSETILICGVPLDTPEGSALQRELFDTGPDQLYRIDVTTGKTTILGPIEGNGAVKDISIAPGDSTAFVTEKRTGKLFRISL